MVLGPSYSLRQYNGETTPNSSIYPLVRYTCAWARPGAKAGDTEMKVSAYGEHTSAWDTGPQTHCK